MWEYEGNKEWFLFVYSSVAAVESVVHASLHSAAKTTTKTAAATIAAESIAKFTSCGSTSAATAASPGATALAAYFSISRRRHFTSRRSSSDFIDGIKVVKLNERKASWFARPFFYH